MRTRLDDRGRYVVLCSKLPGGQDGVLTGDLEWFDDGVQFGTGTGGDRVPSTTGLHMFEARVTDFDGETGTAAITNDMVP